MSEIRDAKRIAENYLSDISRCEEYENAYVFFSAGSDGSIGGADSPVAILKKTGEAMGLEEYFEKHGRERIREVDF